MGNTVDRVPVVSQFKSLGQVMTGDARGARETQEHFSKAAPVISQMRSLGEVMGGNPRAARETQEYFIRSAGQEILDLPNAVGSVFGGFK